MTLAEFAPAKVNLHLHVTGRRDDGYHLLDSLVVFANVGDRLTVSPAKELSLSIRGPFAETLRHDDDNLVLRAACALAVHAGIEPTGGLILEKNLPVASGLGGGSADAAAGLRLLSRFWGVSPCQDDLHRLARTLGADVPVCLDSRPALLSGAGEVVSAAPLIPEMGMLLINPGTAVSTPSVFRTRTGPFSDPARFGSNLIAELRAARNDLEQPAKLIAPVIGDVLCTVAGLPGCRLARMSGSGATCFGLFDTPSAANAAAKVVDRDVWWVWSGGLAGR